MLYETIDGFVQNIRNYRRFRTGCTELLKGFVVKLRNFLNFSELKKVLYKNYKTIFIARNLKSFSTKVRNLESSVKYLFFLEWVVLFDIIRFKIIEKWRRVFTLRLMRRSHWSTTMPMKLDHHSANYVRSKTYQRVLFMT